MAIRARQSLGVPNLTPHTGIGGEHLEARLRLVQQMQQEFVADHPSAAATSHQTAYQRAARLMRTSAGKAFDLDEEPAKLRDAYGRNRFGQGCLLARRLVERGVPFIEVSLGGDNGIGWDTHTNNFETVRDLSQVLDAGWATLMDDLKERGLLESTLIVWMGEFGRTPTINGGQGPGPFPRRLDRRAGWWRHQGRAGDRQDQRRRRNHRTTARFRSRPAGHGLPGPGRRSDEVEPVQHRPSHLPRGQSREAAGRTSWPLTDAALAIEGEPQHFARPEGQSVSFTRAVHPSDRDHVAPGPLTIRIFPNTLAMPIHVPTPSKKSGNTHSSLNVSSRPPPGRSGW